MTLIFPCIGNVIIPTDFHFFQRGWNHQPVYHHFFRLQLCILEVSLIFRHTQMECQSCVSYKCQTQYILLIGIRYMLRWFCINSPFLTFPCYIGMDVRLHLYIRCSLAMCDYQMEKQPEMRFVFERIQKFKGFHRIFPWFSLCFHDVHLFFHGFSGVLTLNALYRSPRARSDDPLYAQQAPLRWPGRLQRGDGGAGFSIREGRGMGRSGFSRFMILDITSG